MPSLHPGEHCSGNKLAGCWQVNQQEWSYGFAPTGSGVYFCKPKLNPMYNYRETVTLGITPLGAQEVRVAFFAVADPSAEDRDVLRTLKSVSTGEKGAN